MLIGDSWILRLTSLVFILLLLLFSPGEGCGPGRGSGRRRKTRKLTPLVFKQHVPNVSENTLGASGLTDGRIRRGDAGFKDLVRNNNPDIIFKDEEGTGADRIMSQRCKDKLNTLAISVLNQWPGVKLRVTEAWDEDGMHAENSLHYEGRAVDITTSDRDRSKYGMLARLAVEAGFDWVYYETRGHIHCSVKSDSSVAINFGGCFPPTSHVITDTGYRKTMSELAVGDRVLTVDQAGRPQWSPVIAFLDSNYHQLANYYTLTTQSTRSVTLTPKHLIYVWPSPSHFLPDTTNVTSKANSITSILPHPVFAEDVKIGQYILYVHDPTEGIREDQFNFKNSSKSSSKSYLFHKTDVSLWKTTPEKVVSIQVRPQKGVYAPLTTSGTLVVDDHVTSCYAFIEDTQLSHAVFAPLRGYHVIKTLLGDWLENLLPRFDWTYALTRDRNSQSDEACQENCAHWYARLLHHVAVNIIGMDIRLSL